MKYRIKKLYTENLNVSAFKNFIEDGKIKLNVDFNTDLLKSDNDFKYYDSDLNCYIEIHGVKSEKTVDVFTLCPNKGFICECKISHKYFDAEDLKNLNDLYYSSNKILTPYIITLAPKRFIEEKLNKIALNDKSNAIVHWYDINVISVTDVNTFFYMN